LLRTERQKKKEKPKKTKVLDGIKEGAVKRSMGFRGIR
jgi:hypothetical protein